MAQKFYSKELVSLKETVMANSRQADGLIKLLIEKSLIVLLLD